LRNHYDRRIARPSHIRPAILELLSERSRHGWSIDELKDGLGERGLRADFSSVFRAVGRLEKQGEVERVELDDGKTRYEVAGDHHEHIRCETCGSITPVPCGLVSEVLPAVSRRTGYEITSHRLVLSGSCPACATGRSR
jgi:Fur family transcriptional regulator, ferric uptake regulator